MTSLDSFRCCKTLQVGSKTYAYFSLPVAERNGLKGISRLPFSMKVLLENLLRNEDGRTVTKDDIKAVAEWLKTKTSEREIAFRPARVLMQDFTGVPAVVDLAAMRDAMKQLGGDPKKINPQVPVDLVIDHSVAVTFFGNNAAFKKNVEEEYRQNQERYKFLKWAQRSFDNFAVVPPGTGICHQVNLEYLSRVVWNRKDKVKVDGKASTMEVAYPDTLVGTDSHTTMVNGLSVLGWGVGGIEAEAAMLGQPLSMVLPEVIGFKLAGKLKEGVTATDLVLTVTEMLRKRGVVGKFVEFFGPGLAHLTIADRATLGNMSPEYGATCGFSPIDDDTIRYMKDTGRPADLVALVAAYAKAQGMFRVKTTPDPIFTDVLKLELSSVEPSLSGPKRPQDRVALKEVKSGFAVSMDKEFGKSAEAKKRVKVSGKDYDLAIRGEGFFKILLPDGRTAYTRDGSFELDAQGRLVTAQGNLVQPGITIPQNATSVSVNSQGQVFVTLPGSNTPSQVGQLELSLFVNKAGLQSMGDNLYLETPASGAPQNGNPTTDGFGNLQQGFLEQANVEAVSEISDLIAAQRAYEMNAKVITAADQMLSATSNLMR